MLVLLGYMLCRRFGVAGAARKRDSKQTVNDALAVIPNGPVK